MKKFIEEVRRYEAKSQKNKLQWWTEMCSVPISTISTGALKDSRRLYYTRLLRNLNIDLCHNISPTQTDEPDWNKT